MAAGDGEDGQAADTPSWSLDNLNWTGGDAQRYTGYGENEHTDYLNPQGTDYGDDFYRAAGYNGPTTLGNEGGADNSYMMHPQLSQWLKDNNYKFGFSHYGNDQSGGLHNVFQMFNGNNQGVGNRVDNKADSDKQFGYALSALGAAGGAYVGGAVAGGYGAGSVGTGIASGAGGGAAGASASTGGDPQATLKGGITGAVGGAVAGYNPAGAVGITDPQYAKYFNNAVGSGVKTAVGGGSGSQIGQSVLGSATNSAVSAGMQTGASMFGNDSYDPNFGSGGYYTGSGGSDGSTMNLNNDNTQASSLSDWMGKSNNYSSPMAGSAMGQYINAPLTSPNAQQPSMDYSPGVDFNPSIPAGGAAQPNPYKAAMMKALGLTQSNGQNSPGAFDNMAGNLMQLYQSRKNSQQYGGLADNLQSLYGQNSPYAQHLQQSLLRADAAAGRRSQVGPRSVELQARLADLNSRNAPEIARLRASQQNNQGQTLQSLMRMGGQTGAFSTMGNSLRDWFNPQPQTQNNNGYGGFGDVQYGEGYGPQ